MRYISCDLKLPKTEAETCRQLELKKTVPSCVVTYLKDIFFLYGWHIYRSKNCCLLMCYQKKKIKIKIKTYRIIVFACYFVWV